MINTKKIIKNRFYTGSQLSEAGINKELLKVADRQGILIGIAIDKPSHQVTSLEGNTYALKIPKENKDFYIDMNISPYSKKIYYGENIVNWLKTRIDPNIKIQGKKKGQALRKLSTEKVDNNFKEWSKKYDEALTAKFGKSFLKDYKTNSKIYLDKAWDANKFKSKQINRRFFS